MTNKQEITVNNRSMFSDIISWFFGILFFSIGLLNTFWGNDIGYGIFIIVLSFFFLPPVNGWINKRFGFTIPLFAKTLLAVFILWSALGVAELFDKINLMVQDLG